MAYFMDGPRTVQSDEKASFGFYHKTSIVCQMIGAAAGNPYSEWGQVCDLRETDGKFSRK